MLKTTPFGVIVGHNCVTQDDIYSKLLQNRIIILRDDIDSIIAGEIIASLLYLNELSNSKEITVYINSGGGDYESGLAIYDVFQYISAPIKTICIGKAYSCAADLLAAGTHGLRYAAPNADIMIHGIQAELSGSAKDLEDTLNKLKNQNIQCMEILARHTGNTITQVMKDCESDKYMTALEALEYGIVDKILSPSEDKIRPLIKKMAKK